MGARDADFARTKQEVMQRYKRGYGSDVQGLDLDLHFVLGQSPLLESVRVKKSGDESHLIVATCKPTPGTATMEQLAGEIERLWVDEIWKPLHGTEAHLLSFPSDEVILEFIAVRSDHDRYVTGKIVIDLHPTMPRKRGQNKR
jgi:hypothetical protein